MIVRRLRFAELGLQLSYLLCDVELGSHIFMKGGEPLSLRRQCFPNCCCLYVSLLGIKMNPAQKWIQTASSQADEFFNVANVC